MLEQQTTGRRGKVGFNQDYLKCSLLACSYMASIRIIRCSLLASFYMQYLSATIVSMHTSIGSPGVSYLYHRIGLLVPLPCGSA